MTELHEFEVGVSRSSSEELMPRVGQAADKNGQLAARWEKGCRKYEAALKSKAKTGKTVRKARGSGNTVEEALADLLRVKREIDQFVLANRNSTERPGDPFFVGMLNFAAR